MNRLGPMLLYPLMTLVLLSCRAVTPAASSVTQATVTASQRVISAEATRVPTTTMQAGDNRPSPTATIKLTSGLDETIPATNTLVATVADTSTPIATTVVEEDDSVSDIQETRPTSTPPAEPTILPTSSPTTINYFRANVEEADPGETITLDWMTTGAESVTLYHMMDTGQFGQFWDVEHEGAFEYLINENERNQTTFALAVSDTNGNTQMETLTIPLRCLDTWFISQPPDICPQNPALPSAGAEQHFEHGIMIWVGEENHIFVLFEDGNSPQWNAYQDEWSPGMLESDPTLSPPPGLMQPVRGFGFVWREQPGVKDRLGWATNQETAYTTALQRTSYAKYNETYIRALDGQFWRLLAERSGWEKISG
jgi:hypothetical protein